VEFDLDVVAGAIAEGDGRCCGLAGFGAGTGARGQVFVGGAVSAGGYLEAGEGANGQDSPQEV
jgi:hypothetical protein